MTLLDSVQSPLGCCNRQSFTLTSTSKNFYLSVCLVFLHRCRLWLLNRISEPNLVNIHGSRQKNIFFTQTHPEDLWPWMLVLDELLHVYTSQADTVLLYLKWNNSLQRKSAQHLHKAWFQRMLALWDPSNGSHRALDCSVYIQTWAMKSNGSASPLYAQQSI